MRNYLPLRLNEKEDIALFKTVLQPIFKPPVKLINYINNINESIKHISNLFLYTYKFLKHT
jgi:hypothetical protein